MHGSHICNDVPISSYPCGYLDLVIVAGTCAGEEFLALRDWVIQAQAVEARRQVYPGRMQDDDSLRCVRCDGAAREPHDGLAMMSIPLGRSFH